jgi:hypothetical protein
MQLLVQRFDVPRLSIRHRNAGTANERFGEGINAIPPWYTFVVMRFAAAGILLSVAL